MIKKILTYLVEIAIAARILWYDQRLFFLYLFAIVMIQLDRRAGHFEKILRVFATIDGQRILAVIRHLDIPEKTLEKVKQEFLDSMTQEQLASLTKDNADVFR